MALEQVFQALELGFVFGLAWADKPLHIGQTIRVTDMHGWVLREAPVRRAQAWLQRNGLPTGMYMLSLMEKGKKVACGKVVWVNP